MPLFQNAVLNKFLLNIDEKDVDNAWGIFCMHFKNAEIQKNIRASKEEEYQSEFLSDLFVNVLGYTKFPAEGYNLKVEQKDEKGSKKADGAVVFDDKVNCVIELKGSETTDLDKVEAQAFGYKNYHRHAEYVVISNFEKLRFYIENAVEHLEFNLFKLTKEEFKILWLCLACDNLKKGLPKKIKDASLTQNEEVTKKLYADYSEFKHAVFQSIVSHNPDYNKLQLFKKTQKLLDRFLFIFFAEDQQLLPPNSIRKIIEQWEQLKELDEYRPLYDRFKKYFEYLNTGHRGKDYEIFAYNGGLFAPDSILDNITIEDELLHKYTLRLSTYDFASDVDVNILGHIFEHSLNEIEEITAELEGQKVDTTKTRRKKDGVFYTPKYITQYIVENTVGKLCDEKKSELNLKDEEYIAGRQKNTKKKLLNTLEVYRAWLLDLTICDPACGSGAFLNQTLEFLLAEHRYVDELQSKLLEQPLVISDIESRILEKNLFGVDINEESVEIAKLSLWLRTAQIGRKLTSLNNNIKCGNSLIDDREVAGEKAFNWETEFSDVFRKGGFDVVIGNPPYGAKLSKEEQRHLSTKYIKGGSETAISFIKMSYDIIKRGGSLSFIIPKSFSYASNYGPIREYILSDLGEVVDCGKVWNEVNLEQVIFTLQKSAAENEYKSSKLINKSIINIGSIHKGSFNKYGFLLNGISNEEKLIGDKISSAKFRLNDIAENSRGGTFQKNISENGELIVLGGAEIQRHGIVGEKGRIDEDFIKSETKAFIKPNSILVQNIVAHILNPVDHIKITACLPGNRDYVIVDTINQITVVPEYDNRIVWYLLNSKILNWYCYRFIFGKAIRTMHFDNAVTNRVPIPEVGGSYKSLITDLIIRKTNQEKEIGKLQIGFLELLKVKSGNFILTRKLENWHELTFKQFLSELKKKKVNLSLKEESEWMEYFNEQKAIAVDLKTQIAQTDREIDQMVYELYGLTEEEIQIVESN